jgi:HAD superfamily hydrolase (TIGR01509 family)
MAKTISPQPFPLIILDYGGVYSFEYVTSNFIHIMQNTFQATPTATEQAALRPYSHLLGANRISTQDYIKAIGDILGSAHLPTVRAFEDATIAVTNPPSPEMVRLVQDIQSTQRNVSLLSDMYLFEVKKTKPWGRYDGFDHVSFSAEAGATKKDPEFFWQTLEHFSIAPGDALFVDDTQTNIDIARSLGIATLHADKAVYEDASQLANAIRERLAMTPSM